MPFLVVSVLPLLAAAIFGLPESGKGEWIAWCSTLNALFSCGDLFGIALIWAQVPRHALVRNKGYKTFWKWRTGRD